MSVNVAVNDNNESDDDDEVGGKISVVSVA